jgi:ubiquinone/menaquinone biosynthesis C-methylase UbiE
MSEQKYFTSNEKDETELNRLRLLEEKYHPTSIRHLETTGISEGWNCLEIGAGSGSVAQWLSARVGPTGTVVATDIDLRFLRQLNLHNLEIRQHNILKDDLETGYYNLVHCRCLLMHLSEPEEGLRRMVNAVRPGGWLVIEELDAGSFLSADITNPSAAIFTYAQRVGNDFLLKRGTMDPYFGRRVRSLIEQIGFADIGHEGWTCINRGGEPEARFTLMTIQVIGKSMITAGMATQEQLDSLQRLLLDPNFYYPAGTLFAAWGRRPFR